MRLVRLELERYGAFTGRSLAFREGARLHVVLGANEAGKSTALAAVTDLLFGIGTRTRFAFLHDMPEMRIGAEIEARDGRRLGFRRRKGTRNTLVDAVDAALPDDALTPFLQGLSREVFCRAFGLDAQGLRAGGREMLDSDGEVGASLFAAASGLRGYRQLQAALDEEATGIFAARRAGNRSFYQALDRYEEARKAIRAGELRAGDWRELNEEIEAAAARLDGIRTERERIAGERARLERLRRVIPLVAAIDELERRGQLDRELVEASEAWIDRLGTQLTAVERAGEARTAAAAALAQAERDLAGLGPEQGLVARSEEIFEAFRGIDRFDKDGLDLPRIRAEADGFGIDLDRLAVRIGLPDAQSLRSRQPSDAGRSRIEALIREGRERAAAVARLSQDLAARRDEQARLAGGQGDAQAPVDPAALRADVKALAGLHGEVAQRDTLDATVRRETGMLRNQASRLTPPVADLEALVAAGLPSPEAVARFRQRLDAIERERERAADRVEAAAGAVTQTQARLRRLEAGRPIPTRDDLAALRGERDRLLAPLRAAALGETAARPFAEAARYEAAVAAADRAADDLATDAARVAEKAADLQRLDGQLADAAAARETLAAVESRAGDALDAWRQAWEPAGIAPGTPAEMAAWLTEIESLADTHQVLEDRRIDLAGLVARIERARAPLLDLSRRAGLDDLAGADVGLILTRIEDRIAGLSASWDASRERQARHRAAAEQVGRLAAALDEAEARHAAWQAHWAGAVAALALREGAAPDEAESALAAWRAVPAALAERDNRLARVAGIERDMKAYAGTVERLVAQAAPDLATLPTTAAMKALQARLQAALTIESRRTELTRRRDDAARGQDAAAGTAAETRGGLLDQLAGAGLPADADAAALHGRLVARRALRADLAERRAELARAADGLAEAGLRADLADRPAEAIDAALQGLRIEDEELDQRGRLAYADRDRHERRRAELEAGTGAETAAAQKKSAEAELQAHARQWAVLKFANLMLSTAIGRHRAGQQDPLLERAGALFSGLTGGAFAGLGQDYGEADEPRIVGRRASGGTSVPVEGLSEGTRDQLYLALRLAYLQDYAARAEPAPFVGDDLFSTFDDARTAHGLEALASIGETIQPILFTHHRHVADLAESRLGGGVDIVAL